MQVPSNYIASFGIYLHGEVQSDSPCTILCNRPTPCVTVCVRAQRKLREHDLGIFRGYPIMLGAAKVSDGQLVHELIRNLRSVLPFS